MPQRKSILFQWEKEVDLGSSMSSPKIFGGWGRLLIEPVIGDYFDIPMTDPAPPSNPNPITADKAFGLGVESEPYTRDTNYLEDPMGKVETKATVGKKVNLLGGRHSTDRKAGKRVLIPTQESYIYKKKLLSGATEDVTKYKVKSFTFPSFFNISMIRQLLGMMIKKKYPQIIKIEGSKYDFIQFPPDKERFTPKGASQATSGAWLVADETEAMKRPSTTLEEHWNILYTSVKEGIPI